MKNLPKHVALIPDGNRRWAKKKGLAAFLGHEKGVDTFKIVLEQVIKMKIPYFTFWGTSLDNITKRPKGEINYLYGIIEKQFREIADDERTHKNKVKIQVLGRWEEFFPLKARNAIKRAIEKTKHYNSFHLTFLMAYNGTDEMKECIKTLRGQKGKITEKTIKQNLWTKNLPAVDLVIRTGIDGDPHMSAGFMMWDIAYAQLYFTETYFPAFSGKEFEKAVFDYSERQRRKGA